MAADVEGAQAHPRHRPGLLLQLAQRGRPAGVTGQGSGHPPQACQAGGVGLVRAGFEHLAQEVGLGQGAEVVRMTGPEAGQVLVEGAAEVDLPQLVEYLARGHRHFIALIEQACTRPAAVEAGAVAEQVGVVLVVDIETLHHQLRQCQRFAGRAEVFPAAEGARAAMRGVEPVQVHRVRVQRAAGVLLQDMAGDFAGHLAHVGAMLDQLSGQVLQLFVVVGLLGGQGHGGTSVSGARGQLGRGRRAACGK